MEIIDLLRMLAREPIEHILMSKEEKKVAGKLIRAGLAQRGHADTKQGHVQYVITREGKLFLEE